ncbi:hypothetical protein [Rhizobium sp. PL01]|uniref:hypothetical protein n=1 Tax=Rhizobium sp. PL01 TaxID=3085631 RepID=UPI0029823F73|nr:hypothetical protein [Rhizobium sp. PL01]MDW5314977.1 hypothetical protein [Rhizobium sp. PL01]
MTVPAFIKKADLSRMAEVASAQNVCVEVEINGSKIRVFPAPEATADTKTLAPRTRIKL